MTVPEEYKKTVKSALNMLAYAENTKKGLVQKLKQKGYSPESIKFTIEYLEEKRLLNEERYLFRLVENLAKVKGYGEKRIKMELIHKGFSESSLRNGLEDALLQVDFDEVCYNFAKKVYNGDREKTFGKLIRHGHSYERAARVLTQLENEFYQNNDPE